jgi:hypothetical protein
VLTGGRSHSAVSWKGFVYAVSSKTIEWFYCRGVDSCASRKV